jgi:DUF971 family protein
MSSLSPQALRGDAESLTIQWSDGQTHQIPWRQLRKLCPCATCKVKREAPAPLFAVLKPEETQPVKCSRMEPMGNYAYHIDFSDGHNTGIYSYDFLRRIGEGSVTEESMKR